MVGPLAFYIILTELQKDVKNFVGGNLRYFSTNWYKYTKDKYILDIITNGLKLDLKELPTQNSSYTHPTSSKENEITSIEITKLLKKLVTVYSTPYENESISGIFTRDKKDGNTRPLIVSKLRLNS